MVPLIDIFFNLQTGDNDKKLIMSPVLIKNILFYCCEKFLIELYCSFILRKKKCSYDFRDYKKSLNVYYNHKNIRYKAIRLFIVKVLKYPMKFFSKFGV